MSPKANGPALNEDKRMLEFKTSKGTFTVQLFDKQAPITVENFYRYADEGFSTARSSIASSRTSWSRAAA